MQCSGAVLAGALVVGGCGGGGDDVPADGVAKVNDVVIKKSDYERLYPAVSASAPNREQAKIGVMQILLQGEWTRQEAAAQTLSVSDAAVKKAFDEQKKQAFKSEQQYRRYLRQTKRTEDALMRGVRQQLLMDKLSRRASARAPKATDSRIAAYYEQNRKEFRQPTKREVHLLVTRKQDQASQAKQQLSDGAGWKQVTVRYAADPGTRRRAGETQELAQTGIKPVDAALAAARENEVRGPLKTQFGWILFEVEKVTPASQPSLDEVRGQIKSRLAEQLRQRALDAYVQDFQSRYQDRSTCADEYKVAECSNGPERNPTVPQTTPGRPSPTNPDGNAGK